MFIGFVDVLKHFQKNQPQRKDVTLSCSVAVIDKLRSRTRKIDNFFRTLERLFRRKNLVMTEP